MGRSGSGKGCKTLCCLPDLSEGGVLVFESAHTYIKQITSLPAWQDALNEAGISAKRTPSGELGIVKARDTTLPYIPSINPTPPKSEVFAEEQTEERLVPQEEPTGGAAQAENTNQQSMSTSTRRLKLLSGLRWTRKS